MNLSVPWTEMRQQHGNHNYSGPEFPSAALRMHYRNMAVKTVAMASQGQRGRRNTLEVSTAGIKMLQINIEKHESCDLKGKKNKTKQKEKKEK